MPSVEVNRVSPGIVNQSCEWDNERKDFINGAGRSGLAIKAFAMRLMHLGFNTYVIGETPSIVNLGEIAKEIGSKLAVIISNKNSKLEKISDIVVIIPGITKENINFEDYQERQMTGYTQLAPLETMFELTALVFFDAVIFRVDDDEWSK